MDMTPVDFARQYLLEYTVKGGEIIPTYCPFCHGGKSKDKRSFALNVTSGTYNCKRGTCGVSGSFRQLCEEFGVKGMEYQSKKAYKKPEFQPLSLSESAERYVNTRGISRETMEAYRVGTDKQGNLQFPYYDDAGNLAFNKFRYPRKLVKGEKKAWREAETKPILYGMWKCEKDKPLCIFEGEFDCMAGHEAGIPNCVSVPSGAEDFTWVDTCWDWLQSFEGVYLYGDNDDPGVEMVKRLSVKIPGRVYVVSHEYKDANELLYRKGADAVKNAYDNAKEVPVAGILNLADVVPLDIQNMHAVSTLIAELNKRIGGFLFGDVTVWTGKRGEGKSTMLSMMMLDAIEDGKKVCAYSGELRADRFQYWTDLQAAGRKHIMLYHDAKNSRQVAYVPTEQRRKIHGWYSGKYWLYDNAITASDEEMTILNRFELAARRYDCRVFMVDNLMTADYGKMSDSDFYRQQSRFVGQLVAFANRHNVHVHLVAHPRKTSGKLENDDVAGSGDITNRASNVISISRVDESAGLSLNIIKNRWEGNVGTIALNYCKTSHRLYEPGVNSEFSYGWEFDKDGYQVAVDEEFPF